MYMMYIDQWMVQMTSPRLWYHSSASFDIISAHIITAQQTERWKRKNFRNPNFHLLQINMFKSNKSCIKKIKVSNEN